MTVIFFIMLFFVPSYICLLYTSERMIAGVCGGLAEYFGWDPTLVRIVYALATIFTAFAGIIIYLILWIIMPEERYKMCIRDRLTYLPTTSPYGYSSFLKEESLVAFATFFIFGLTDFTFPVSYTHLDLAGTPESDYRYP